jgi:hypothetical protein
MPHKKRANKNHIQVKKILANSERSLLDRKRPTKSGERVPRRENSSSDRKREQQILNDDDSDDDRQQKRTKKLKEHIQIELNKSTVNAIPKKSRRNKYYAMNHPELETTVAIAPRVTKRSYSPDDVVNEQQKSTEQIKVKKLAEESKPTICDKLLSHMVASRFRYLNEKLYTSTSKQAQQLFENDPQSFHAYHQGYSVCSIVD